MKAKAATASPRDRIDDRMTLLRLMRRVTISVEGGCWEWGGRRRSGYGQFDWDGRGWPAHRAAYMLLVGDVPDGRVLDHLCRNRGCVNPEHLEPVTESENSRRGWASETGARRRERTRSACRHGHPLTEENTYYTKRGWRQCRTCRLEANRQSRRRRLERQQFGATFIQVRYDERPCIDCGLPTIHPVGTCDRCQAAASRVASRSPRDLVRRTSR